MTGNNPSLASQGFSVTDCFREIVPEPYYFHSKGFICKTGGMFWHFKFHILKLSQVPTMGVE